ncbi:MAG: hypothetical protein KDB71_15680 [Mycobacterium sp.]|nr:hypothetical protein [Mycobacterium sp.]
MTSATALVASRIADGADRFRSPEGRLVPGPDRVVAELLDGVTGAVADGESDSSAAAIPAP